MAAAVDMFHFAAGPDHNFKGLSEKWPATAASIPLRIKQNVLRFSKPTYSPPTFGDPQAVKTAESVVISDSANSATSTLDEPSSQEKDSSAQIVSTTNTDERPIVPSSLPNDSSQTNTIPDFPDFPPSSLETLHDPELEEYLPGPLVELCNRILAPFLPLDDSPNAIVLADFTSSAPFTYQRLSELLDEPTKHYKTLPAYLRALERVVSVVGTIPEYIEIARQDAQKPDGEASSSTSKDEEELGFGLHPIPWLSPERFLRSGYDREEEDEAVGHALDDAEGLDEMYEKFTPTTVGSPHSHPSNSVPGDQSAATPILPSSTSETMEAVDDSEETPHARGPAEIGVEDKGPQTEESSSGHGIEDLEVAMGRPGEGTIRSGSVEREVDDSEVKGDDGGKKDGAAEE